MTTKEEKARLKNIAILLNEIAEELSNICGVEITNLKELRDFTAAQDKKKEKPEPKGGDVKGPMKIGGLNIGDEGITVEAEILDIERSSGIKKGKAWEGLKVSLSDKTGPIKLVLWNEQVEQFGNLQIGDIIRVEAWKVEKGYKGGVFELVYGKFGTIKKINIERHII